MRYLTRVSKKGLFGQAELQLLAEHVSPRQDPQASGQPPWVLLHPPQIVLSLEANAYSIGTLLIADIDDHQSVIRLEDATNLLVGALIKASAPVPNNAHELTEIERWRQSLTRQSQELRQREAEIESRQEQLQQWELKLRKGSLS